MKMLEAVKEIRTFQRQSQLHRNNPELSEAIDIVLLQVIGLGPYWENIQNIAYKQRHKGLRTYGIGIECNKQPADKRLEMLEEELVDSLMYLEWLRAGLEDKP